MMMKDKASQQLKEQLSNFSQIMKNRGWIIKPENESVMVVKGTGF